MRNVLIGYMIDGRNSGIDKYLLRVLDVLKEHNIHADILTGKDNEALRACLKPYGAEIFEVPSLRQPGAQYQATREILRKKNYDAAYFNISEPMNCVGAMAAHSLRIPKIVIHSHNSSQGDSGKLKGMAKGILNTAARRCLASWATECYACSTAAAKWLFPQTLLEAGQVKIIYNPIEIDRFSFSPEVREIKRRELGVEGKTVIGHVGNYVPAKNSSFLLDILEQTRNKNANVMLLSVGDGPQRAEVEAEAAKRGLSDEVLFLGVRDDVPELLQAMDVFVLPSLYEGLPVSAIEAQAAGLPALLSDRITDEVCLGDACRFLPVEDAEVWADAIMRDRGQVRRDFRQRREQVKKFDIDQQKDAILAIFQ